MKTWKFYLVKTLLAGTITLATGLAWMHGHPTKFQLVSHIAWGITTVSLLILTVIRFKKEELRREAK